MSKYFLAIVFLFAFLPLALPAETKSSGAPSKRSVDFVRDVQPIFSKHCLRCHGPKKQRSRFRLDRRAALLRGGSSGSPAIVVGHSDRSWLIQLVTGKDPDLVMPPRGRSLSDREIATLRAWIDTGAKWPGQEEVVEDRLTHWSFQPLQRPGIPRTRSQWGNNPIDSFILAKLESVGLSPSPRADARTRMRRASILLTGLPATPEEVQALQSNTHPDAHARMMEALLASPAYGERWARHWLDIVRFADTNGFETNTPRPNAWHYRDYVIEAFNADKPYHAFVREQLVGDQLGDERATGFLVAGPYDTVKSPDINLTLMQRQDELHDMINTTSTAFLGLTVACARCHHHKFDPITQQDYYAFQAVFAGVRHGERPLRLPRFNNQAKLVPLQQRLQRSQTELSSIEKQLPAARLRPPVQAKVNQESFPPTQGRYVRFQCLATNTKIEPCLDELEVFDLQGNNVALATAGARATSSGDYAGNPKHRLAHIHDGKYGNSRSWIANTRGKGWVQIELARPTKIQRIVWGRDRQEKYKDRLAIDYRIEVGNTVGKNIVWQVVASSRSRLPYGTLTAKALLHRLKGLPAGKARRARELIARIQHLKQELTGLSQPTKAYVGKFVKPDVTHRLYRGDPRARREVVAPGAVTALNGKIALSPGAPEHQRRLALANWMVDRRNPLTARVIVNRIWQHHFGEGLVATPSDFGKMGVKPTHPKLLDWLACELMASGWSLKHLQRLIVSSATWQQSSQPRPQARAIDAQSRLLWRFPPRRVEAEVIRDSILALAGSLNHRMGGPGFNMFEPNNNYVRVYTPRKTFGPEHWRRMIYVYNVRMEKDATVGSFDCPDAGQPTAKRPRSTTAIQALSLLNSPFVLQQADRMAKRLQREVGPKVELQVERAFALALGRSPSVQERTLALELVRQHGLASLCRALFNANELLFVS